MDYTKELERLKSEIADNEYWSPSPGKYKVKGLSEIEEATPFENDIDKKPRRKMNISVDGKKYLWTFPFGKKEASIYRQLVQLGSNKEKLTDEEFTIIVIGNDQDRRYTLDSDSE